MLKLDVGESEAITLAIESGIKMIILDDKSARKIARNLGLDIIGTIGILIKLKELNYIDNLADNFDLLDKTINFRIGQELKIKILQDSGEL